VPSLPSLASVGAARAGATVLAVADGSGGLTRPLVATQRFGRGRVLAFAGEAAWRWRMLLPSTDTTYPTFWRQAVRWLAGATPDPVAVRTRALGVDRLEVIVEARDENFRPVRDAAVQVHVRHPEGTTQELTAAPDRGDPGAYRAEVRVPAGVVRVDAEAAAGDLVLGRATGWALSGPDGSEFVEPRRNDAQLARLAERLGGRLVQASELGEAVESITSFRGGAAAFIERDMWHAPWVLLTLTALLVTEWTLRRRWGLR
jgi:hypothetical protein